MALVDGWLDVLGCHWRPLMSCCQDAAEEVYDNEDVMQ